METMSVEAVRQLSFGGVVKIMENKGDATRNIVKGLVTLGVTGALGVLGIEMAALFVGAELAAESGLSQIGEKMESSGITGEMVGQVLSFFEKHDYTSAEKSRTAHVMLVFSAYFDEFDAEFAKAGLTDEEKLKGVNAAIREWENVPGTERRDILLSFGDNSIPGTKEEQQAFYRSINQKISETGKVDKYIEKDVCPLFKSEKRKAFEAVPVKAAERYRQQFQELMDKFPSFRNYAQLGGLETIQKDIHNLQDDVSEIKRNVARPPEGAKHFDLPPVPSAAAAFVEGSRDREVNSLRAGFGKKNPIWIWGVGGIGKTEVAKELAKRWEGNAYFTHFMLPADEKGEAMEETILRMDITGYKYAPSRGVDAGSQRQEEFRERLGVLKQHFAGALLVIDNCDRPGKNLDDLRGEQSFQALLKCGLQIVLTTRYPVEREPDWQIKPMEDHVLLEAMRRDCPNLLATDEQLLPLIRQVDGHTLMCILMARTLDESWGDVTPERMLNALRNSTLAEEDFPEVTTDQNLSFRQAQIYEHMKALFRLTGMEDADKTVLRCAALLPQDGMDRSLFKSCLKPEEQKALHKLVKRGWLQTVMETTKTGEKVIMLQIHPVVREVCLTELKPSREACGGFLKKLWDSWDEKRYDAPKFRQLADCFARASEKMDDPDGECANCAGRLYWEVGQAKLALFCLKRAVKLVEGQPSPDQERLALGLNNLGSAYGDLGDYSKALEYKEKALTIREKVQPENHPNLAQSYNNVGATYGDLGDHKKELEYMEKALAIREQVLPENHPDLARSYNNVGVTYDDLGDHEKALEYMEKALAIWVKALPENHPDLATSYNNVGSTYGDLGDHEKALEYKKKALAIREQVLPENHPDLAWSYNNVGYSYGKLGDHEKELEYQKKAAGILERALPAGHPDLIAVYQNIMVTCFELGDTAEAILWMEKAEQAKALREKLEQP